MSSLEQVLAVLRPALDVLNGRVNRATPPAWCERRGWTHFLLGLSESELERAEEHGLLALPELAPRMPASLAAWLAEVARATQVPRVRHDVSCAEAWRGVRERKRAQLAAMLQAVAPMAGAASRIVDFGSGSGHFSRLASRAFATDVLGLERSAARVARATQQASLERAEHAEFLRIDLGKQAFALAENDLAFGLHACGELGDRLVLAASAARCDLMLVSCCAQKISTPTRRALSRAVAPLELERGVLGLSNLSSRGQGVETSLRETLRAREVRHALGVLLKNRSVSLAPGAEMRGVNRRQAHGDFASVARRVFAVRQMPEPSASELSQAEQIGREEFASVRRLSLPRNALARLLELTIVLDRAQALAEAGLSLAVAEVFAADVTPRNLCIFASRYPERLPPLAD
ncbi:MAG TPA: methyltransferase [Polyangiaceae bacterium]